MDGECCSTAFTIGLDAYHVSRSMLPPLLLGGLKGGWLKPLRTGPRRLLLRMAVGWRIGF